MGRCAEEEQSSTTPPAVPSFFLGVAGAEGTWEWRSIYRPIHVQALENGHRSVKRAAVSISMRECESVGWSPLDRSGMFKFYPLGTA